MQTKICKNCQKNLPLSLFITTARGVPHVLCNSCKSSYEKIYYHQHKKQCKRYRLNSRTKRFHDNMTFISNYLKCHPFLDCGETDIVVLEFDHRGDKKYSIADMRDNYALEVLQAEVSKCDVRCANCHRRKTAKERNYKILQYC